MCMETELGFPAVQQGSMDIKPHGWVQSRPSQCLPHSLWDFLYWISQDATIVNGPTLVIHRKANETPYSVIRACTHSEDSKWIKLFPQKNVNRQGYTIQIIVLKYMTLLNYIPWFTGLLLLIQMMLYFTSWLAHLQYRGNNELGRNRWQEAHKNGHYWSLNEFIMVK